MFIAVDVGGTSTRVAFSKDLKRILKTKKFPTSKNFEKGVSEIIETIEETIGKSPKAIALGLPGITDQEKGVLLKAFNLQGWKNKPIKKRFFRKFNCPVLIHNDSDLGGLGEAVFGAGKNNRIIAYLSIGTGIGGARIVDKKIDFSSRGFEPGHQILEINGKYWPPCGQKGCLESFASSKAFVKRYKEKPENCHNLKVWNEWSKKLSQGIINIIVLWSPDIVIIGGGFAKNKHFLKPLKKFVSENLVIFKSPPIVKSRLGDKSGLYGGLDFIKNKLKE